MNKGLSVKTIVAIGIGAAVFVVLGRFAAIPLWIPNTNVEVTYPFLALMSMIFGPVAGGLIGLIGHALKDLLMYGSIWWSWVIVSGFVGVGFGLCARKLNIESGEFGTKEIITFNLYQIGAQVIGWCLLAPVLDILIYSEPANKVFVQGFTAALINIVGVGVLGTLFLIAYAKTRTKKGSLHVED